jgi:hypothetical protein
MPEMTITTNHVIQLPKTRSYSTNSMDDIPFSFQDIPEKNLCALIEGNLFLIINRDILFSERTGNNSFAPVYLCDLQPDVINPEDFNKIKLLAYQIIDKSDEIFFDDGMDD